RRNNHRLPLAEKLNRAIHFCAYVALHADNELREGSLLEPRVSVNVHARFDLIPGAAKPVIVIEHHRIAAMDVALKSALEGNSLRPSARPKVKAKSPKQNFGVGARREACPHFRKHWGIVSSLRLRHRRQSIDLVFINFLENVSSKFKRDVVFGGKAILDRP